MNQGVRGQWGGRATFIMAAAGAAIGLGNIWKFPYMAGENGGGAFVLVYLICIAVVGLPILIAEIFTGKESQVNAVRAYDHFDRPNSPWGKVGVLGIIGAAFVLAFYSVVGGWVLNFEFQALTNQLLSQSDETIKTYLGDLLSKKPMMQILWHSVFMSLTLGIVIKGVSKGIEKWTNILMPILFILLGILFVYSMFLDGFSQAISFLFSADFSKLSWSAVLEAVGHSFFTLSIGMGVMMVYGSYLPPSTNTLTSGAIVALLDTVIALVAGIIIFSVVFSFGQSPGGGPKLMFVTLPLLFKQMPGAWFIANAFFILVTFAALSSSISMLEVIVSYISEEKKWDRTRTTWVFGAIIWAVGILCVFPDIRLIGGKNVFDTLDIATSKVILPLVGMGISLYFGWIVIPKTMDKLIASSNQVVTFILMWTTRAIAPAMVAFMLFQGIKEMIG